MARKSTDTTLRRRSDDLLIEMLNGHEPADVRCEAALALAALGRSSTQVVEALSVALEDGDEAVRRAAARALGKTRDSSAAEPLLDTLENAPELWQEAASALSELRHAAAIDRLRGMVRSATDSRTRRGAIRALAALSTSADRLRVEDIAPVVYEDSPLRHPLL
jgi:HEAT repeat protein